MTSDGQDNCVCCKGIYSFKTAHGGSSYVSKYKYWSTWSTNIVTNKSLLFPLLCPPPFTYLLMYLLTPNFTFFFSCLYYSVIPFVPSSLFLGYVTQCLSMPATGRAEQSLTAGGLMVRYCGLETTER